MVKFEFASTASYTDYRGYFELKKDTFSILKVSALGYQTQLYRISNETEILIELPIQSQMLSEINIEIKVFEATKAVLDLVSISSFDTEKIIISSFDWNSLQEIRFHHETIRIGVLTETNLDLALAFAKFIKAYSIHPYFHLLTLETVKKMKEKEFKIFPWTVNEPEDITFVKQLRVDGIITDYPERV